MRELLEQRFAWFAAGLGVLCGLVSLRAGRAAGFIDDDIANLGFGKRYGWGVETFLGLPETRDHIQPGAAALSKLLSVTGPHWWTAQLITAALVAALVAVVAVMVRQLSESATLGLFVAFAFGTSIVIGRIALWWTSASLSLPMLAFGAAVIICSVSWARARAPALLVGAGVAQLLADSFSDRALLLPPIVWAVLVLMPPAGASLSAQIKLRTRAAAPLLGVLVAVAAFHLLLTLALTRSSTSEGFSAAGSLSVIGWIEVVANWWARGVAGVMANQFVPALADQAPIRGEALFVLVAGSGILVVLLALSVRNRLAALAWVSFAVTVTIAGLLFAVGRVGTQGAAGIATVPRYQDITLLALAVFAPLAWALSGRPRPPVPGVLATAAVLAACLAWFFQLRSGIRDSLERPIAAARYASNLERSLTERVPRASRLSVVDDRVPDYVMFRVPQTGSFSWLSSAIEVLAPDAPTPTFGRPYGNPWLVNSDGVANPARTSDQAELDRKPACVATSRDSRWLDRSKRVVVPVADRARRSGRPILLRVLLERTGRAGEVGVVSLRPGTSPLPSEEFPLASFPDGFRSVIEPGTPEVAIDFWGGARTCIARASTASITPGP